MFLEIYNTLIVLWNFNSQKTYLTRWRSYIVEDDAWIDGLYLINNKRNEYFQCSQTQFLDRLHSRWRIQSPFLYQREVGPFVLFHKEECWKDALMQCIDSFGQSNPFVIQFAVVDAIPRGFTLHKKKIHRQIWRRLIVGGFDVVCCRDANTNHFIT